MDKLTWDFQQLCNRNRDGSFSTRAARLKILKQAAKDLKGLGFNRLRANQLKPKHVTRLVEHWHTKNLSTGTIKNRVACMRWWAEKVDKRNVIPRENAKLGIGRRAYVTNENKSLRNTQILIDRVSNQFVKLSLQLQKEFGLRREEAIKFRVKYADHGDKIELKRSWCKGGRKREIPITNQKQRKLLDKISKLSGAGSLIPSDKRYIDQLRIFERETIKAGISRTHGLRHAYAQNRYEQLTGFKSPSAGGKKNKELDSCEKLVDGMARAKISHELGHNRSEITSVYLGR